MQIQNDPGPERFRHESAEDEDIWHVVDMDKIVTAS